jgi:DNA-binding CsgD family transcriptional regulator
MFKDEENKVYELAKEGKTIKEIAEEIDRNPSNVAKVRSKFDLPQDVSYRTYSDTEKYLITELTILGVSDKKIADILNKINHGYKKSRTAEGIKKKRYSLGLKKN